jgi:hypothetical protein
MTCRRRYLCCPSKPSVLQRERLWWSRRDSNSRPTTIIATSSRSFSPPCGEGSLSSIDGCSTEFGTHQGMNFSPAIYKNFRYCLRCGYGSPLTFCVQPRCFRCGLSTKDQAWTLHICASSITAAHLFRNMSAPYVFFSGALLLGTYVLWLDILGACCDNVFCTCCILSLFSFLLP